MAACPYCTTEIFDELNFCVGCEKQVRCLNCGALLYKGKSRCLKCGELLVQPSHSQSEMNTYTLEEKATKASSYRRIEIRASNDAVGALTTKLPFGSNAPLRPINVQEASPTGLPPALPSHFEKTITVDSDSQATGSDNITRQATDFLELNQLFAEHSDHGIIPSKTLREYISNLSSKKERQQVFAIVFVWAYREKFDKTSTHEDLISAMKHEGLYDTNSRTYIPEVAKNYFNTVDNRYELSDYDGVKKIKNIMKAIQNPEQPSGNAETKKISKRGRPAGQASKEELETVKPWLDLPLENLSSFDARRLKSASDWGAFGLYILTKLLKVKEAIEAGLVYAYLTKKFSAIPVNRNSFIKRMGDTKSKFIKNASGEYLLTQAAEAGIKALVESSSTA